MLKTALPVLKIASTKADAQDNLTTVDTLATQWSEAITTARLASQSAPSFPFGTLCGRGAILGANRIWTTG
ncbi:MAG: hypothetical protein ICV80_05600 [Microcoleus sp. T1-bin1]|nr:hypothetical protein [Microcoleus sp. T1-bin1]